MSLLQWVKNGFGRGQRRTSETIPLSPETSGTFEGRPELKFPEVSKDAYAELHAASEEYRDAAFAAAEKMFKRVTAAGYAITNVKLTTFYPTDRNTRVGFLGSPRCAEVELTVVSRSGDSSVQITLKV